MLAPIPPKRKDGKTSFADLCRYISYTVDPEIHQIVERGDILLSEMLLSKETAADEMRAVAAQNTRCKDPVYHYILAWQEDENPSQEQWKKAALKTLSDLGFSEHQYMAVSHHDTHAFHVHVMVNRIHPERYRAHYPKYSKLTLDKSIREIEAAQGWKESRGLYRWDPVRQQAVKTGRQLLQQWRNERETNAPSGKAAKVEIYTDNESLERYCMAEPAKAVKTLLQSDSVTWDELHATLKTHGLSIQAGEKGGYTVGAIHSSIRVKASKVFRDTFAGKENRLLINKKLGEFRPPSGVVRVIDSEEIYIDTREPLKRDTEKRAYKREERAKTRQNLKQIYVAYKQNCFDQLIQHSASGKIQYKQLKEKYRERRALLRRTIPQKAIQKAALSILAMQAIREKEQLRNKLKEERLSLRPRSYRDWVTEQAQKGNEAAISQLRGFLYREKRKKRGLGGKEDIDVIEIPKEAGRVDPTIFVFPNVQWEVNTRTGDVVYKIANKTAFTDWGEKIGVVSSVDDRSTAIEVAMRLAHEKYQREIILTGSDLFKKRCVEAAVRARLNITFADTRLNELKRQLERQRDQRPTIER